MAEEAVLVVLRAAACDAGVMQWVSTHACNQQEYETSTTPRRLDNKQLVNVSDAPLVLPSGTIYKQVAELPVPTTDMGKSLGAQSEKMVCTMSCPPRVLVLACFRTTRLARLPGEVADSAT